MNLRIKELCKEQNLTVGELAESIGLVRESLSRIISSGSTTTDTLEKIAKTLNVPIVDLFEKPSEGGMTCPNCGASLHVRIEK